MIKKEDTLSKALDLACERISDSGQEYHEAKTKEGWKQYYISQAKQEGTDGN